MTPPMCPSERAAKWWDAEGHRAPETTPRSEPVFDMAAVIAHAEQNVFESVLSRLSSRLEAAAIVRTMIAVKDAH